jgi:ABC-type multidrug transport system ATPase subunit
MRNASFEGGGASAGPVTLDVYPGERTALAFGSAREASIVALMASGIVKPSHGSVLIDDFDPRIQSINCKRVAALVPHEPCGLHESEFVRYVVYRAALWKIEPRRALAHAQLLRKRLGNMHEAFAFPLIGALVGMPKLVVLDRPAAAFAPQLLTVLEGRAVFSTHASASEARVFLTSPFTATGLSGTPA